MLEILLAGLGPEVVHVNGTMEAGKRHPGNLNVTLLGVCGASLDKRIRDFVAVSASSACKTTKPGSQSHVLEAIGAPGADQGAVIRFGVGRFNTAAEIEAAGALIVEAARPLIGVGCELPRRGE
jgi:cysteine desulfurase